MMIKINNLSKSFNKELVLQKINIEIDSPCFIALVGDSGCGKSTLLNIISLMDTSFNGEYKFFDKDVKKLTNKEKEELISNNITYLFQDPKLIEDENIKVNLELISGIELNNQKIDALLKEFDLHVSPNSLVKNLSKGEQKRITLIGAKLRNTPLIICDEITSGLDQENSIKAIQFLKKMSKDHIVILVSHDQDLVKKYVKHIYQIHNHLIEPIIQKNYPIKINSLKRNNKLSLKYSINHLLKLVKQKKVRTSLLIISLIVCLFTMGLSFLISDEVKDSMVNSLTSYYGTNQIVMERKEKESDLLKKQVVDGNEFSDFYNDYQDLILKEHVYYLANFENYFSTDNYVSLVLGKSYYDLNEYGVGNLNTFLPIDLCLDEIYPYEENKFNDDEIIIGLSLVKVQNICQRLHLDGFSPEVLAKYLEKNRIPATVYIQQEEWEYYLEINLYVIGFVISEEEIIYSSNDFFNEYMIEEKMQLSYSYFLNEIDYYPWTTKKLCGFLIDKKKIVDFFSQMIIDEKMSNYSFHILDVEEDHPFYIHNYEFVYFTYKNKGSLSIGEIDSVCRNIEEVTWYLPCGEKSYTLDNNSLLGGFDNPTYLSFNEDLNDEFIDFNSFSSGNLGSYQSNYFTSNINGLFSMSFLDCSKKNYVKFTPYSKKNLKLIQGKYPLNEDEILISKKLSESQIGDQIYLTMLKEILPSNDQFQNVFETHKFKVVGVVDDNNLCIYQENTFPLILSNVIYRIDQNDQNIDKCLINLKKSSQEFIDSLNDTYPDYLFENPLENYLKDIENGLNYLSIGLLGFSLITLVSSLLMIILVNYLFLKDKEKEVAIYAFLGYKKTSIFSLFVILCGFMIFVSLIITYLSLLVTSLIIPIVEKNFNSFSLSTFPFIIILVVSLISFGITCLISLRNFLKQDIIQLIKQ